MTFDIVFVHLLNDVSGSPKVLKEAIGAVVARHGQAKLYVGRSGDGFLSDCGIPTTRYWYYRTGCKMLTLFTYFFSQAILLCKLLCDSSIDKDAVIYVNTLLPFGAALYGRITGRKIIYHVHEISITPAPLKALLTGIVRHTSSLNLYVSDTHMQALPIIGVPARRIYNTLDAGFIVTASKSTYTHRHDGYFNVLMIASLRDYKGVPELVALATSLRHQGDIHFYMVVNDDDAAINRYFSGKSLPSNLVIRSRVADTTGLYGRASLVLNLSRVDQWVETFGLTILEAMAFGVPVIVPPVGGPAELVEDGVQGFHVNSCDRDKLTEKLLLLFSDRELCLHMSAACRKRAAEFNPAVFAENICVAIAEVRSGGNS